MTYIIKTMIILFFGTLCGAAISELIMRIIGI